MSASPEQPDSTTAASPSSSPTAAAAFSVSSADFVDGEDLPDFATASAFGGQCAGDNLNPDLAWSGAPEGTESFAIVMIDRSANNFIHWVHFDIPADVAGVAQGQSAELEGGDGVNTSPAGMGYFGPCPPGPDHRYEFTIYALDATLGLDNGARFADVKEAIDAHVLAQASIVGMRSGPA